MAKTRHEVRDICLGRILNEDEKWLLLEVAKSDLLETHFTEQNVEDVEQGRFVTLVFLAGKPWEKKKGD